MTTFEFDSSGKLIPPNAAELTAADDAVGILAYSSGMLEDGRPYYAYIAVKPSRYSEFYDLSAAGRKFVLSDYGKILASGFEKSPPQEVVRYMRETHGFDVRYGEKLTHAALQQQAVFLKAREQARISDIVAMLQGKSHNSSQEVYADGRHGERGEAL
jgi:hypothetical protein